MILIISTKSFLYIKIAITPLSPDKISSLMTLLCIMISSDVIGFILNLGILKTSELAGAWETTISKY